MKLISKIKQLKISSSYHCLKINKASNHYPHIIITMNQIITELPQNNSVHFRIIIAKKYKILSSNSLFLSIQIFLHSVQIFLHSDQIFLHSDKIFLHSVKIFVNSDKIIRHKKKKKLNLVN